jgi:hypothetical protein
MDHQKHKNNYNAAANRQQPRIRVLKKLALLIGLITVTAVVAGILLYSNNQADYKKLVGKWMRPDGGYVIDIKSVSSNGKIDAAYFNPDPIKISKAVVVNEKRNLKIFVELQDKGYPGCTYKLNYEPLTDKLRGIYYQAAIKENFDIYFVRIK